jgi:hypothetical protein
MEAPTISTGTTTDSKGVSGNKTSASKDNKVHKKKTFNKRNTKKDTTKSPSRSSSKGKRDTHDKKNKVVLLKKGVTSIEFDATARYEHLTGFSARKRARRAYGLAQQQIKDRNTKLEHRAAKRNAERDFIAEAEKLKQQHYHLQQQQQEHDNYGNDDSDNNDQPSAAMRNKNEIPATDETVQMLFDNAETEQQWGGHVVVTTSTHIPGDSDNEDDHHNNNNDSNREHQRRLTPKSENHDVEQVHAGKVEKYIKNIQSNLPSKKKKRTMSTNATTSTTTNKRSKGQHGATQMKGIGSAADMKTAQKMLSRSTTKMTKGSMTSHGKKGRKRK